MNREEFMLHAEREVDEVFRTKKNRIMNLIEQAWSEGKRNAEKESVISFMKETMQEFQNQTSSKLYHLYCEHCKYDWWTPNAFPEKCPKCSGRMNW